MKKLNSIIEAIGEFLCIFIYLAVCIGLPIGAIIALFWFVIKTANWLKDFIIEILNIIFK